LSLFDDAKVRRFSESRIIFFVFFAEKRLNIDKNQVSRVRTQHKTVPAHNFMMQLKHHSLL
jgi:hypothetical protein